MDEHQHQVEERGTEGGREVPATAAVSAAGLHLLPGRAAGRQSGPERPPRGSLPPLRPRRPETPGVGPCDRTTRASMICRSAVAGPCAAAHSTTAPPRGRLVCIPAMAISAGQPGADLELPGSSRTLRHPVWRLATESFLAGA